MIAAAAAGAKLDASLGAQAKLRSKHNTFMLCRRLIMLSNHFPVATYGNRYGWQVLVALVVVGWIAAGSCARLELERSRHFHQSWELRADSESHCEARGRGACAVPEAGVFLGGRRQHSADILVCAHAGLSS